MSQPRVSWGEIEAALAQPAPRCDCCWSVCPIAVEGYHSQGGWVAFVCLVCLEDGDNQWPRSWVDVLRVWDGTQWKSTGATVKDLAARNWAGHLAWVRDWLVRERAEPRPDVVPGPPVRCQQPAGLRRRDAPPPNVYCGGSLGHRQYAAWQDLARDLLESDALQTPGLPASTAVDFVDEPIVLASATGPGGEALELEARFGHGPPWPGPLASVYTRPRSTFGREFDVFTRIPFPKSWQEELDDPAIRLMGAWCRSVPDPTRVLLVCSVLDRVREMRGHHGSIAKLVRARSWLTVALMATEKRREAARELVKAGANIIPEGSISHPPEAVLPATEWVAWNI